MVVQTNGVEIAYPQETAATLLNALESANVKIKHSCRRGFCGACKVNVEEGQVENVVEPLMPQEEGTALACCCRPVSDKITISF